MANFGASTDHFGILALSSGGGTLADVLSVTGAPTTPMPMNRAEAENENGDPIAATWFGNSAGELYEASNVFVCKSGSFSLSVIKGGEVEAGKVITQIEVGTSNKGWPQITVTGKLGTEAIVAPDGELNTWTMPDITVTGAMRAQLLDFTVGAGCRLTASGITATLQDAQQEDGLGEPIAHGISGGLLTQTAQLQRVTAAPSWTCGATWNETQAPGVEESQAAYHTANAAAEKLWTRDTDA